MLNRLFFLLIIIPSFIFGQKSDAKTYPFEQNQTHTFRELIDFYEDWARKRPDACQLSYVGSSDYGIPMPLFIINKDGHFNREAYQAKNVVLINNAIHPGEPCGVDACVKLTDWLFDTNSLPEQTIIAIIPFYNIGGGMNRNCCSRANQNGPEEYGFRGNAKNLDLNRDFIKADSENTLAFYRIFHLLKPAIFVDTHTSNGADYQHFLTLITSQRNKMTPELATFTEKQLNPHLFEVMALEFGIPMVPYVHSVGPTPDSGIKDYLETPRYSTGYTNLFNCISYVTEAHMLKPFEDRVLQTFVFLDHLIDYAETHSDELREVIDKANANIAKATTLPLNWKLDTNQYTPLTFWGYEARYKKSQVTQVDRLFYDQKAPYKKEIRYYNTYTPQNEVRVPEYYIIPQAWRKIAELLKANDIAVFQLSQPHTMDVETYYIKDYKTVKSPYESHYLHYATKVDKVNKTMDYRRGDFIVPVKNENARFIVETLEPEAPDSYFAWNYFDGILQQKEWFSAYVFEDEAAQMLRDNPQLKNDFETRKEQDSTFAQDAFAQLYFLYRNSDHYERTANFYPVTRLMSPLSNEMLIDAKL